MRTSPDPVATLKDPEVKKYFLALLDSSIPAEEKYQAFIRVFELEADLSNKLQGAALGSGDPKTIDAAVAKAAKDAWQPKRILEQTKDSLERALRRLLHSQHQDGGWGFEVERSHPWMTAWSVLCLDRALRLQADGTISVSGMEQLFSSALKRGLEWVSGNRRRWSVASDDIPAGEGRSVYEAAVALRCLYQTAPAERSVEGSIQVLLSVQRPEGDWDATLWGGQQAAPDASQHEVGATSFALQALAATRRQDRAVEDAVRRGMEWLKREQGPDGCWFASAYPPYTPVPVPSVNKTCDALQGLRAGRHLGLKLEPYQAGIDKAVQWLLQQEQAVFGEDGTIKGWGWKDIADETGRTLEGKTERDLLENTCLTLETLLESEAVAPPLLASNALWLIRKQLRTDTADDGKWSNEDTGRIAFALLDFYCRIKESPAFGPATAAEETADVG